MTDTYSIWEETILSVEFIEEEGSAKGLLRIRQRMNDGSIHVFFIQPEKWEKYKAELRDPKRHYQEELSFRGPTEIERKQIEEFIDMETPKSFCEHTVRNISCRLICGTIPSHQNVCSGEYDLFYRATLVPVLSKDETYEIVCEIGFDVQYECQRIHFQYNVDTATVYYSDDYRTVNAVEEYQVLKGLINYEKQERVLCGRDSMPWIRFPRTKDGISIPLLLWWILEGTDPLKENQPIRSTHLRKIVFQQ